LRKGGGVRSEWRGEGEDAAVDQLEVTCCASGVESGKKKKRGGGYVVVSVSDRSA
jgi:hypothetical protein